MMTAMIRNTDTRQPTPMYIHGAVRFFSSMSDAHVFEGACADGTFRDCTRRDVPLVDR
jgi:hypothetical protein